jgi:hypothetical protein
MGNPPRFDLAWGAATGSWLSIGNLPRAPLGLSILSESVR